VGYRSEKWLSLENIVGEEGRQFKRECLKTFCFAAKIENMSAKN